MLPMPTPTQAPPDDWTLYDGRVVQVRMPNLFAALAQAGRVPNPLLAAVLDLLVADKAYRDGDGDPDLYVRKRDYVRGVYAVCALCLVSPRLVLDRAPEEGEIGPEDLGYEDAEGLYRAYFRGGYRPPRAGAAAGAADPGGAAPAAPDGGDVRGAAVDAG